MRWPIITRLQRSKHYVESVEDWLRWAYTQEGVPIPDNEHLLLIDARKRLGETGCNCNWDLLPPHGVGKHPNCDFRPRHPQLPL